MYICPHVCVFIGSMNNILTQVEPQLEESPGGRRGSRAYQVLWVILSAVACSHATLGLFSWMITVHGEALGLFLRANYDSDTRDKLRRLILLSYCC